MLVAYNALLHFLGTAGELQRAIRVYQVSCCCGAWASMHGKAHVRTSLRWHVFAHGSKSKHG